MDLAIAFLGATNASDLRLQNVIDRHIRRVLDAADGNITAAAALLGVHRRSLQRILQRRRSPRRRPRVRRRRG